ncbi:pentapeptide repeat-containing protein [Actinopolymorpha alba]|uniref:pentapeptide repeat-containing protein n=1 Tax=Actinopolymorpha alba TaxID=533267 RepID=UPI000685F833|nr:pentapeptide repeat-containing protein [Actinopolymorpha alba]
MGSVQQRTPRPPVKPRIRGTLAPAVLPEHDVEDEAQLQRLTFTRVDMSERDATSVDVEECEFTGTDLNGSTLAKAIFADCRFESSDLANVSASTSSLLRCSLRGLRATGLRWIDGTLRDVVFGECRMDLAQFRFTTFKNVHFVDCHLRQGDFTNADLRGVVFSGCDLTGAQFAQAKLAGARFHHCVLDGIRSVTSLQGAIIDPTDLVSLSYAFADALGILIESGDGSSDGRASGDGSKLR